MTIFSLVDCYTPTCLDCDDDVTPATRIITKDINGCEFRLRLCEAHAKVRWVTGWRRASNDRSDRRAS